MHGLKEMENYSFQFMLSSIMSQNIGEHSTAHDAKSFGSNIWYTGLRNKRHLVLDHSSQRLLLQSLILSLQRMVDIYLAAIT